MLVVVSGSVVIFAFLMVSKLSKILRSQGLTKAEQPDNRSTSFYAELVTQFEHKKFESKKGIAKTTDGPM